MVFNVIAQMIQKPRSDIAFLARGLPIPYRGGVKDPVVDLSVMDMYYLTKLYVVFKSRSAAVTHTYTHIYIYNIYIYVYIHDICDICDIPNTYNTYVTLDWSAVL